MVPKSWQEHVIANIVSPMRLSDEHNMGAKLVDHGQDGDLYVFSIGWLHHRLSIICSDYLNKQALTNQSPAVMLPEYQVIN